jgi:hypothetical protein
MAYEGYVFVKAATEGVSLAITMEDWQSNTVLGNTILPLPHGSNTWTMLNFTLCRARFPSDGVRVACLSMF